MSTHESHDHAHDHNHGEEHEEWAVHAHISDVKFLVGIFAALIVLTVFTVAISRVDLGAANTIVAVLVATVKASLVATFFMHLRHDKPFNALIFISAFVFLGVFLFFTLDDLSTRGRIDPSNGVSVYARNGEAAPGGFTPIVTPEGGEHGAHGAGAEHGAAAGHEAAAPAAGHDAPAGEHH